MSYTLSGTIATSRKITTLDLIHKLRVVGLTNSMTSQVRAKSSHSPFSAAQAATTPFTSHPTIKPTKSPRPEWKFGEGVTSPLKTPSISHVEIDPFEEGRSWHKNYTLLISGIAPRPIGFISTISASGEQNLSPFSYFQVVDHDPPVFIVAFTGRAERPKDTLANLQETGEGVINMVSEDMVEAMNATSVDAPLGVSEWELSGLTRAESKTVKPPRVKESVFSIETKLVEVLDFKTSRKSVRPHGCLAVLEATRFWVREDAIDEGKGEIDLNVLRPVAQLGGMSYGRITETYELPRIKWENEVHADPGLPELGKGAKSGL